MSLLRVKWKIFKLLTMILISFTVTVRLAPKLPISVVAIQFNDIKVATQTIVDIVNAGVSVRQSSSKYMRISFF